MSQHFTLLYVEDNKAVRESTAELFQDLFKQVLVAEDGEDGLALYQDYFDTNGVYIDIVITDIQMPKLDGVALSKALFKINRAQKVLIVSAYSDTKYLVELINIGVNGFIQKPLSFEQIFSVLSDVCTELEEERELSRFLTLSDSFKWDHRNRVLSQRGLTIRLTEREQTLLTLLISDATHSFTALELFDHLYEDDSEKEFSPDIIKSLIKRLRKKIPQDLIINTPQRGYSFSRY